MVHLHETLIGLGLVGANAVLGASFVAALLRQGAPFVPTSQAKATAIFSPERGLLSRALAMRPTGRAHRDMHVVDLGSGEGGLVRAATRQGGFGRATGVEINPALVALARLRSFSRPCESHLCASLWSLNLSDYDIAIVYGIPPIMDRLSAKLQAELPKHALIVSNAYELRGLGRPLLAQYVATPMLSPDGSGHVFVYTIQ